MKRLTLATATALAAGLIALPALADNHKAGNSAGAQGADSGMSSGATAGAAGSSDLTTADKADDSKTTDIDQQADASADTQGSATTGGQAMDKTMDKDKADAMDKDSAMGKAGSMGQGKADQQAMAGAQPSQGQIISSINNLDVNRVRDLGDVSADKVRVVKASSTAASDDAQGLDNAIDRNQDQIAQLRETIDGNDTLSKALEDQGASSDDVIGAEVGSDDSVTIYTRD